MNYLNIIIFLNIEQILIMIVKLILIIFNLLLYFFQFLFLRTQKNLKFLLNFFLVIFKNIFYFDKMLLHLIFNVLFILQKNRLNLCLRLLKLIFSVRNKNLSWLNFLFDINHNLWNNLYLISFILINVNALWTKKCVLEIFKLIFLYTLN